MISPKLYAYLHLTPGVSRENWLLHVVLATCLSLVFSRHLHIDEQQTIQQRLLSSDTQKLWAPASCEEVFSVIPKARESRSCSLGYTRGFVGPLNTWTDVKNMLQARSYNGEIILTHETRPDVAAQWVWRTLRAGYAHTVVLSRGEHSCSQLSNLFTGGELGCVWFPHSVSHKSAPAADGSSGSLLDPGQVALFLEEPTFWRLQLAAMVLRLGGYNLLTLDTDVVLQDDFYWWMQQPEYKDYNLLMEREGTDFPTAAVMYARGASPSGPTAWALAEAVLRNVRWQEQPQLPPTFNCTFTTCYGQAVVTDSIYSALVGRPVFLRCLENRPLDMTWANREDGRKAFLAANEALIGPALERRSFSMSRPGPACHAPLVGSDGLWGREGRLRLPHFAGRWPPELGGRALGDVGRVARSFLQMLEEAGPPMWPDPEDPAAAAAAASGPLERYTQFSHHLACDWHRCGSQGMFLFLTPEERRRGGGGGGAGASPGEGREEPEPCVVIGHLTPTPDHLLGKRLALMANGHYSMALAAAMHGPGGPFFATNTHLQGGAFYAARTGQGALHARRGQLVPLPRVIALHPGAISPGPSVAAAAAATAADAAKGDPVAALAAAFLAASAGAAAAPPLVLVDKAHMISVVEALSSVSVAAGRTLALPRLSCDYDWMHRSATSPAGGPAPPAFNGSHQLPWTYLAAQAFTPFGPSLDRLSCEWLAWVQHGCLHGPVHTERHGHAHVNPHPTARMLLSYELDYLIRILPEHELDPLGAGNLLRVPPGGKPASDGVYNITVEQVSEQLSRIPPERTVVWMERPMRVVDLSGPPRVVHQQWVTHCCGLSWPLTRNHICFGDF